MKKLRNAFLNIAIISLLLINTILLYNQVFRKYPPALSIQKWEIIDKKTSIDYTTFTFHEEVNITEQCFGLLTLALIDNTNNIIETRVFPATSFTVGSNKHDIVLTFIGTFKPGLYTIKTERLEFCSYNHNAIVVFPELKIHLS